MTAADQPRPHCKECGYTEPPPAQPDWFTRVEYAIVFLGALAVVLSIYGAIVLEPSAREEVGHCYRVDARSFWLYLTGPRRFEVTCP